MFLLGVIQSLFEGAMFIFVFMWTPALEAAHAQSVLAAGDASAAAALNGAQPAFKGEVLPHGIVFACFMACIMLGSRSTNSLLQTAEPGAIASVAFLGAALLLAVPIFQPGNEVHLMLAFCGFEVVCGMYFPLAGIQRSHIVPEGMRSMIMNVFRVGLNAVVMSVLLNIGSMQQDTVFKLCVGCLLVCCLAQVRLSSLGKAKEHTSGTPSRAATPEGSHQDAEDADMASSSL